MLKKVLIITYYWPPAGGVPVQRWVKMTKYLRKFGWEPVIYTVTAGEYPVLDSTLAQQIPGDIQVIKTPIREPYTIYKQLLGYKKDEKVNAGFLHEKKKQGVMQNLAVWVRGNFFIPDARKFWIKPSVKYLTNYLKNNPVHAIISTGPPHSMHLIAAGVKQNTGIPWIADFRDPWTKIDYYSELKLSAAADKKHHQLEKKVLTEADKVVTVSWQWADDFNKINNGNTEVITNGFDAADFDTQPKTLFDGFVLHHVGMINKARNPELLWAALEALCNEHQDFNRDLQIRFTGKSDYSVLDYLKKYHLENKLFHAGQVDHAVAIDAMQRSTVLLLLLNDTQDILGRIPAKLFEYLAAKRPVLAIGNPEGDAAKIIRETQAGIVADFKDIEAIKSAVLFMYKQFQQNTLRVDAGAIDHYSREQNAKSFADLLNRLT